MSVLSIVVACVVGLFVFALLLGRVFRWATALDEQAPQPPQLVPDRIPEWMTSTGTPPSHPDSRDGWNGASS